MTFENCPARRYIKTGKKNLTVYHCGEHTCVVREQVEKNTEKVDEILKQNPTMTPSQVQSAFVLSAIRSGENWQKVFKEASAISDKKWIENRKQSLKKATNQGAKTSKHLPF